MKRNTLRKQRERERELLGRPSVWLMMIINENLFASGAMIIYHQNSDDLPKDTPDRDAKPPF